MVRHKLAIWLASSIVILDQIVKALVASSMTLGQSIPLLPNMLHLTLVHNRGAGFGMLQGARLFFIIFSIAFFAGIVYYWNKIPERRRYTVPLGLVLAGLIGNFIDRIRLGYVIDFVDLRFWPVFNVADMAISIAIVWLIVLMVKEK